MTSDPIAELVAVARDLFLRGMSPGTTGNLSVRLDEGTIAVTPTDSSLGYLADDELARLELADGHVASGPPPSKEAALHRVFYADPVVHAVVHLHSPWATAVSCLEADISSELATFTPYFRMKVAPLAVVPYFEPGSAEGAGLLAESLDGARAALLRNHGSIAAGSRLLDAVNKAEEIEHAAHLWFITRGHALRPLPEGPAPAGSGR